MKLIKLTNQQKSQICGSGFNWIAFWGLSLITSVVVKSLFADTATVGINGVGRASWEKKTTKPTANSKTDVTSIVKILRNIYEF